MKRFYLLLIAFITALVLPVYAMPTGEADQNLNITKDYNDTAFFAGETVNVDSKIDGLGFTAGRTVTVKGQADYSFVAGETVTIDTLKTKDLYVAGNKIKIDDANARNIYGAAQEIAIDGDAKELFLVGETVTLKGEYDNVYVSCENLNFEGKIYGKLYINEDAKQTVKDGSSIAKTETYKEPEVETKDVDAKEVGFKVIASIIAKKIISTIKHFLNVLIIGFLTILIFKNVVTRIDETSNTAGSVFAHFGIGLGLLILVPILAIILLFTGFASGLGFVGIMLYILGIYLSSIVGGLYVGKVLFKKMNTYLRFFLTTLILTVIYMIPIIGGFIEFFMLCLSLGLMGHICLPESKKGK